MISLSSFKDLKRRGEKVFGRFGCGDMLLRLQKERQERKRLSATAESSSRHCVDVRVWFILFIHQWNEPNAFHFIPITISCLSLVTMLYNVVQTFLLCFEMLHVFLLVPGFMLQ